MQIDDIADVQVGYHSRVQVVPDPGGTYQIIQVKDFDEQLRLRVNQLILFKPEGNPERYEVTAGDVLFLSRGQRNFAAAIKDPLMRTVVPSYFYIIRLRARELDPEYLAWFINSPETQMQLKALQRGTQISMVPMADFKSLEVNFPPLHVQRTIVQLDALMEREKHLCRRITDKRAELVHQMGLHGIKNSSIEREPKHG